MLLVPRESVNTDNISLALEAAANKGEEDAAKALIDSCSGQGIIQSFTKGLIAAVEQGHEGIVRRLLESGDVRADISRDISRDRVRYSDPQEETVLSVACQDGRLTIASILIAAGARISEAAMEKALKYEQSDLVDLLTARGGNMDEALQFAAQYGRAEITKLLLAQGAYFYDPQVGHWNAVNFPLHLATRFGHRSVVRLLVDKARENDPQFAPKRKWDALGKNWETALHVAAEYAQNGTMQLLLEGGLNVHGRRVNRDTTFLHLGALMGHTQADHMLLSFGADINAQDMYGRTSLHEAVRHGHANVVEELLQWSPDFERWDQETFTALHDLLRCGHLHIMRILLKGGADANARDGLDAPHFITAELWTPHVCCLSMELT